MLNEERVQTAPADQGPLLTVGRECCLSGAPAELLAEIRRELTIDNPKYQDAKRFSRWIGKQLKPQLFFFREEQGATLFSARFRQPGGAALPPGHGGLARRSSISGDRLPRSTCASTASCGRTRTRR